MKSKSTVGFHEYLRQGGGLTRLIGNGFSVGLVIIAGEVLSRKEQYFSSAAILGPLISDPFTILATAVLILSYTDLHFMEFRLRNLGHQADNDNLDQFAKQRVIPAQYQEVFGNDVFVKAWRIRLVFLLLFSVAALRWILTLKR
jgi:hypothetical protein